MGTKLTPLDFKFNFFPWFRCPDYAIDASGVQIDDAFKRYFDKLRDTAGIELTPAQRAWYVKKAGTQLSDMKREYPSTPEEAFEASLEGAYYADQLAAAELQGRVGEFPAEPGVPVDTAGILELVTIPASGAFSACPTASGLCITFRIAARACRSM